MERKVTLNGIQKIELTTYMVNQMHSFRLNVALDSFHTASFGDGYDSEESAFNEGVDNMKIIIMNHVENSRQPISELDQELVIKFLEL
jgi:hypothetical protein